MIRLALTTLCCTMLLAMEATAQVRDSTPNGIGASNRSQSFGSGNFHNRGNNNNGSRSQNDYVTRLTEQNLLAFLQEVQDIATGKRPNMMDDDVVTYMNNHVADKAKFKSVMNYQIPGFPNKNIEMELGKKEYIETTLKGRYTLQDYETRVRIEDLDISGNGKKATFTSITDEAGMMPFPKDPNKPNDVEMLPINGTSTCQQTMIVSFNNFIQMADAKCRTKISFDPFAGEPLVPD